MNARDILAILDTFRVSSGDKQRMEAEQQMRLDQIQRASSARIAEQRAGVENELYGQRQQAQTARESLVGSLEKANLGAGMPENEATPAAWKTYYQSKAAPVYEGISAAESKTAGNNLDKMRAVGEQQFGPEEGAARGRATISSANMDTARSDYGTGYWKGATPGSDILGQLATTAGQLTEKAKGKSAERSFLADTAQSSTEPTRIIAENMAKTGEANNAATGAAATAPLAAPAAVAAVKRNTAMDTTGAQQAQFTGKELTSTDPTAIGQARTAEAQAAGQAAQVGMAFPAGVPKPMVPGAPVTKPAIQANQQLQDIIRAQVLKQKAGAPNTNAPSALPNRRELGTLD